MYVTECDKQQPLHNFECLVESFVLSYIMFMKCLVMQTHISVFYLPVGASPSKKIFICFNESPLKLKKNAFYLC